MSRLRLAAGCGLLKLACCPRYAELITADHFQSLAYLVQVLEFYVVLSIHDVINYIQLVKESLVFSWYQDCKNFFIPLCAVYNLKFKPLSSLS